MIAITVARPEDSEALAELAEEMDRFYGATRVEPIETRLKQINDALFDDIPIAYSLLAWEESRLVGFATYSFLWPAVGLTRSIFLKELYVARSARQKGIGKLLMERLFDLATQKNCSRVEWMTDSYNRDAQLFYAKLGAPVDESKIFYRVEGEALKRRDDPPPA